MSAEAAGRVTVCGSGCDYAFIAAALPNVSAGGTIEVLDVAHTEAGIVVDKDVIIAGLGASDTIVQAHATRGEAAARVFEIAAGTEVMLRDLKVRHGYVSGTTSKGGGILNHGTLILERVAIEANDAVGATGYVGGTARGGGVYSDGELQIVDSTISTNSAQGGAGYSRGGDGEGAGVFAAGEIARFKNVTISGNDARRGPDSGG
jgi:hypothetical protein